MELRTCYVIFRVAISKLPLMVVHRKLAQNGIEENSLDAESAAAKRRLAQALGRKLDAAVNSSERPRTTHVTPQIIAMVEPVATLTRS